jgi:hypothetical protein
MTAQEHTRRLITLIFAGQNRMVMIRRELPRTKSAGWVRKPYRIEAEEGGSPSRGLCTAIGSAVRTHFESRLCRRKDLLLLFDRHSDGPDETQQFPPHRSDDLIFVFATCG